MRKNIALFGAAGKIGMRITNRLKDAQEYEILYVEAEGTGQARLVELGLKSTSEKKAVQSADVVVLAVPDIVIGAIAKEIVPRLKSGAMVIYLDPAVPYSGQLPSREDIAYFVVHPCHPPVVNDETDLEAKMDFFGGVKAKQPLVCALMQGSETDYEQGEAIAQMMFAPITRIHRITVEQMALLEPAMAETVVLTCIYVMKEAMEEAVRRGVPREAARDFILGHINIDLGIHFDFLDAQFSDGAKKIVQWAKERIFHDDWKDVFEPEVLAEQVAAIAKGWESAEM
jgi:hypothetical protein